MWSLAYVILVKKVCLPLLLPIIAGRIVFCYAVDKLRFRCLHLFATELEYRIYAFGVPPSGESVS